MVAADVCEKPKRAQSAYMLFTGDIRSEVTKEYQAKHGKANLGEIAKLMSARWAALGEAEKKVYDEKAAEAKAEHEEKMKEYKEATDPAGCLKKKFEHLIPKRSPGAYFLFTMDETQRQKAAEAVKASNGGNSDASHKEVTGKLGEIWKAMSAKDREPFEAQHKKAQAEFEQKWKVWEQTPEFAELAKVQAEQKAAEKEAAKQDMFEDAAGKSKESKKRGASTDSPPTAKRGRAAKTTGAAEPVLDEAVIKEAAGLGLEGALKNLAARPKIMESGSSPKELLNALKTTEGLVNKAQHIILGA